MKQAWVKTTWCTQYQVAQQNEQAALIVKGKAQRERKDEKEDR